MAIRTNLYANPSFELTVPAQASNAGTYTSTTSKSAAYAFAGTSSMMVTQGNHATVLQANHLGTFGAGTWTADAIAVPASRSVTFSSYLLKPDVAMNVRLAIAWFNASHTYLSIDYGANVSADASWKRASITVTAPAGAVDFALVWDAVVPGGAPASFYADGVLVEDGAVLGPYFDGSTVNAGATARWTGTANASTSTETANTVTNLLTNPSFEVDASGWTNVTRANSIPARLFAGSWYGQTGATTVESVKVPATAGLPYAASAYVSRGASARTASIAPIFYNASNVELPTTTVPVAAVTAADTPERFSAIRVAPAGTTQVALRMVGSASAMTLDACLLEQSSAVSAYFDGSTTRTGYTYSWTGTAHVSTSNQVLVDADRANLIPNSSFEVNATDGWAVAGTRAGTVPEAKISGSWYMAFITAAAVYKTIKLPAVEGKPYAASATFNRSTTNARSAAISLHFFNAGGTELSPPTVTETTLVALNVPELRSHVATAPVGTTQVEVWVQANNTIVQVDAILLEQASVVGTYFDGSTANAGKKLHAWSGTAHNSQSTELVFTGYNSAFSGSGVLTTVLVEPAASISSDFTGSGALSTAWSNYVNISSGFAGSGVLTTKLTRHINSAFTGSGALTTALTNYQRINSAFTGSGALSTSVTTQKLISSAFSGSGSLATHLARTIRSSFTGSGALSTALTGFRSIQSAFYGEGTLTTEISGGVVPPEPETGINSASLGKLSRFTVNTSAVRVNPAEGSGSTPSVSATYIRGVNPEFALGETNLLINGAIGTYEGEIVSLRLAQGSDSAAISADTPLTLLNTELHLRPFIDGVPGTWTAARAIDYWTQQAGLFYDKVPGECVAYASGFGHTDSFGASTTARFYEKLVGGTTTTLVTNGRSVKTLGSAVTGTTALHEVEEGSVTTSLPLDRKLVFSIGLGLAGTGRTGKAVWKFRDTKEAIHTITLSATSAGLVMAKVGSTTLASTTVPVDATYRLTLSLERLSGSSLSAKLTVHTDNLIGAGTLEHDGAPATVSYALPGVLKLTAIDHVSAGGSGAQMTRWGTYLTVTDTHPMELPKVQKVLAQSGKPFGFVSGFQGNVWSLLNEFCAIARLDVQFLDAALRVSQRITELSHPGTWAQFDLTSQRREKYKQVAVVNKQSKSVDTDDAVLWRADSVFSVNAREVFETTVQTEHSIINVLNPVPVLGITPFPYKQGTGQYVVTGADGYIVAPEWWTDNGGMIEVALTETEGELAIKITAPGVDSVRAPYRISEGAADRPALYISGSGIINDPKEIHVATGAKNAREGFDQVFESPFIAGLMETYDTAMAMASVYSASAAEVSYELPNSFDTPTGLGQFPAGTLVTDNSRNFRIMDAQQTHARVSGTAVPHTTIGAYVASYPAGATIADEKARHAGRTIRQFNIKPLKGDS